MMTDAATRRNDDRPAVLRLADGTCEKFASVDDAMDAWRDLPAAERAGVIIEVAGQDLVLS